MNIQRSILIVICAELLLLGTASAQLQQTGDLAAHVDSLLSTLPGTGAADMEAYQIPAPWQLDIWDDAIVQLLQGDAAGAAVDAARIGYCVVDYVDNSSVPSKSYYILEKHADSSHYWGILVINPRPSRGRLFIQSPHPLYDSNTGRQGVVMLQVTGARAWFMSGTHRCNSTTPTTCDGLSTSCTGSNDPYPVSDHAHATNGTLQRSTEVLEQALGGVIVVQNHGFGKGTGDPDVIMGNGRTTAPTGTDYLIMVRDTLFAIDNTLAFKVAHVDIGWTELIGTTNVQGRLINGSSNPCNAMPSAANGRFLHIEQALPKLRDSQSNRLKLANALARVMQPDALTLTSPNGGESYAQGEAIQITWTSTGTIDRIKIEYSLDDGSTWYTITSDAPNAGSYLWTTPAAGSWRARVRISDPSNADLADMSAGNLRINGSSWPTTGSSVAAPLAATFGPRMLSGVYDFHRGLDMPNVLLTPIRPASAGVIARFEDSSQTLGTTRERYGNWMLIRHDSVGGQPRHTAYAHVNAFNGYQVGDTVSTEDTIAFMGKSGVGINTVHLHLEYYQNLTGTALDNDKAFSPLLILPYINGNGYSSTFVTSADSSGIFVEVPKTELDFDGVTLYGSIATRTIRFSTREGIDPGSNDNPRYNNVFIDPMRFTIDSTVQRMTFWTKNSEIGLLDSAVIRDVHGYARTVLNSTSIRYAVATGNWSGSIWAATSGGAAGSASVPSVHSDVVLNAGVTVTIDGANAECRSVSFGSTATKIAFGPGSILSVSGNWTLAATTHNAIASWAAGAKLRFVGSATQMLSGWGDFNSTNTSFKEVQINKTGGSVQTPGAASGNGMCVNIVDTLEIMNGVLLMNQRDDIQGRGLTGTPATTPTIVVRAGGSLQMAGSASHIRSGNASLSTTPIGRMSVAGTATLATSSSNGINFAGIDVEQGGTLTFESFSSTQPNNVKTGTVTVRLSGQVVNNSAVNFWNAAAVVDLQPGSSYTVGGSTTVFPPAFQNAGLVRYARTSGDGAQTIADMDYASLEIGGVGTKTWTLAADRVITDTLLQSTDTLLLTSSSPRELSVHRSVRLNAGMLHTGTNTLVLGSSVSSVGALTRSGGVIVGTFKRWIPASIGSALEFPISHAGNDRFAGVMFTTAPTTGGTITAAYLASEPGVTGLPLDDAGFSILNVSHEGYWTLTGGNGLDGGTYTLSLTLNGVSGVSDFTTLRILRRNSGSAWTVQGTHQAGTGSNAEPTARRAGLTGSSEFVIASGNDNLLPVEVTDFSATVNRFSVDLRWTTISEIDCYGYEIERRPIQRTTNNGTPIPSWKNIGFVSGSGTSSIRQDYFFTDANLAPGRYAYRVKQLDSSGSMQVIAQTEVEVGLLPDGLRLESNFPNPFNPSTHIQFSVPVVARTRVVVYNALGTAVRTLWDAEAAPGNYYDVLFEAHGLSSGTYFVRLEQSGHSIVRKILLVK